MTSFRFVHTADIHLDSPMKGLSQYEGMAVERIRTATRNAFANLIDRVKEEETEFLVIAGDLYDGAWKDYNTGLFFVDQMAKLNRSGTPVFVACGNHDAESQITRQLRLPENTYKFGSRKPESKMIEHLNVALHGQSYSKRNMEENLSQNYPRPKAGMFNIGVLHTGLGGLGGHANYAPCTVHDLIDKGYEYWALGHVHARQIIHESPHVVFPGNLQGRHINEEGAKSASLVTVKDDQIDSIEEWECDVVRWHRVDVDVAECTSIHDVSSSIAQALEHLSAEADDDRVHAIRLQLQGSTPLHGQLLASSEGLTEDAQAASLDIGSDSLWVEKVKILTSSPAQPTSSRPPDDLLADIEKLVHDSTQNPELLAQLKDQFGAINLPSAVTADDESEIIQALVHEQYAAILGEASERLIATLSTKE